MPPTKPGLSPEALKAAMMLSGAMLLVAAAFMPPNVVIAGFDARVTVGGVGIALIAWAKRAPGDGPVLP